MTDAIKAVEEVQNAFTEYQHTLDAKMKDSDVLLDEKLARMDKALDDGASAIKAANKLAEESKARADKLELAISRTNDNPGQGEKAQGEYTKAFEAFITKGTDHELLTKALSTDSDPDGGYIVPDEMDSNITRVITEISPMRQVASVMTISSSAWRRQVIRSGSAAGWTGEQGARPETGDPVWGEIKITPGENYALHNVTQRLLDDARVSVEGVLNDEFGIEFARLEGAAFVNGDGIDKPRGFLSYDKSTTATYQGLADQWEKIEFFPTGESGDFASTEPDNVLIDVVHAVKAGYRANASWLMNKTVLGSVRKLRDANGLSLWQPDTQKGTPGLLMGYSISEMEDMDDIAADSFSIAFGDFKRGYQIVDRFGTRILRDPYSNKPFVQFYATRRTGGGVAMFEAIKLIKFAA